MPCSDSCFAGACIQSGMSFALLGPFVLTAAAAALTVATGAPAPNVEAYTDWLAIGAALLSTTIVGLFEEVGWRGCALPGLQRRQDALWAALVLGVIWALWHLPELISDPGQRPPLQFFVWILAESVILAWLYNSTNSSLPIVIICHGAVNTASTRTSALIVDDHTPLAQVPPLHSGTFALTAVIAALLRRSRKPSPSTSTWAC